MKIPKYVLLQILGAAITIIGLTIMFVNVLDIAHLVNTPSGMNADVGIGPGLEPYTIVQNEEGKFSYTSHYCQGRWGLTADRVCFSEFLTFEEAKRAAQAAMEAEIEAGKQAKFPKWKRIEHP